MVVSFGVMKLNNNTYVINFIHVPSKVNTFNIFQILNMGLINRTVTDTAMNRESSRSHAVFVMAVETKQKDVMFHLTNLNLSLNFLPIDLKNPMNKIQFKLKQNAYNLIMQYCN